MSIVISESTRKGFARATQIFSENRQWPDITNGQYIDSNSIRGDWYRVGEYIRREQEKYGTAKGGRG